MKLQSSICAGIDECLTYGMFLKENIDIVNQTSISAGFGAFESVMMRVLKGAVLNYIPSTGSKNQHKKPNDRRFIMLLIVGLFVILIAVEFNSRLKLSKTKEFSVVMLNIVSMYMLILEMYII